MTKSIANNSDARQLVRSSGSIGANYIEANEALSRKDFIHLLKIARKEAKESVFWLRLLYIEDGSDLKPNRAALVQESEELKLILSAIIRKSSME